MKREDEHARHMLCTLGEGGPLTRVCFDDWHEGCRGETRPDDPTQPEARVRQCRCACHRWLDLDVS